MIKPQGASGPGRQAARGTTPAHEIPCCDAKNTKRLDDDGAKRFDDSGKALNSIVAEKTKARGRGRGRSRTKRPPTECLDIPSGPDSGAAAEGEEEKEEEDEHTALPQQPRHGGG